VDVNTKLCKKCSLDKPLSDYSPDKRASDGKQGRCKACGTAANKARYWTGPDKARKQKREAAAKNPEKYKAYSKATRHRNAEAVAARKKAYYKEKRKDPVWQAEQAWKYAQKRQERLAYLKIYSAKNSIVAGERTRLWRKENPELAQALGRNYAARRGKLMASGINSRVFAAWVEVQSKDCYWCDANCADSFHVDHYQPLAKGGPHELSNLVISCPPCNLKKNSKDPYQFAQEVGRLF
jgi:5-methylcytosine-specific restriction endonuclease McrA